MTESTRMPWRIAVPMAAVVRRAASEAPSGRSHTFGALETCRSMSLSAGRQLSDAQLPLDRFKLNGYSDRELV